MTLTLDNTDGDLWNPTVNVSGSISDPTATVYVNGVQGTNYGNGTWSATDVPVSSSGVASFDMSASSGGGDPDASTDEDKPAEIVMESDKWNYTQMEDADTLNWNGNLGWTAQNGGKEHDEFEPGTSWDISDDVIDGEGNITSDHYTTSDETDTNLYNVGMADMPQACGTFSGQQ
ncbi:MAG: hypothetical protein ACREDS_12630, partial [Limisphaerales bacterium]